MSPDDKSRSKRMLYFELFQYGAVGMEMGLAVMIGVGIGWYLDNRVFDNRTSPWLTLFFMAMGLIAAGRAFYRTAKEMREKVRDKEESPRQE